MRSRRVHKSSGMFTTPHAPPVWDVIRCRMLISADRCTACILTPFFARSVMYLYGLLPKKESEETTKTISFSAAVWAKKARAHSSEALSENFPDPEASSKIALIISSSATTEAARCAWPFVATDTPIVDRGLLSEKDLKKEMTPSLRWCFLEGSISLSSILADISRTRSSFRTIPLLAFLVLLETRSFAVSSCAWCPSQVFWNSSSHRNLFSCMLIFC